MSDIVRRVIRTPARPIERYFNRRFQDVHGHLDNETDAVNVRLDEALASTRVLQERVATDVEVISELTLTLERLVERLDDRLDALLAMLEPLVAVRGEHEPAEIKGLLDRVRDGLPHDAELLLSLPASRVTDELLGGWDVLEQRAGDGEAVAVLRLKPKP